MRLNKLFMGISLIALPALGFAHTDNFHVTQATSFKLGFIHSIAEFDHLIMAIVAGVLIGFTAGKKIPTAMGLLAAFPAALILTHASHHGFQVHIIELAIAGFALLLVATTIRTLTTQLPNANGSELKPKVLTSTTLLFMVFTVLMGGHHAAHLGNSEQLGPYSAGIWFGLFTVQVFVYGCIRTTSRWAQVRGSTI